jgi:hypothetical protein
MRTLPTLLPPERVPFSDLEARLNDANPRAALQAQHDWLQAASLALARDQKSIALNRNQQKVTQAYEEAVCAARRFIANRLAELD